MAFAEEYDDGMEELLLDSIVAGATGLHEILTEPLTVREVNEHVTKLLRAGWDWKVGSQKKSGIAIDRLVDVIDTDRPSIIDQSTINQTV